MSFDRIVKSLLIFLFTGLAVIPLADLVGDSYQAKSWRFAERHARRMIIMLPNRRYGARSHPGVCQAGHHHHE
jgi:hypothetical protein